MATLETIASAEKLNLDKMERLENEALSFTASKLSQAVKHAVESGSESIGDYLDVYAETYTASMLVSWMLGQVHIQKQIEESIELANAPILLAVDPVPFQEAIDALSSMIPTDGDTYRQTEASMKLRAFTIANVSSVEAVNRVKKLYEDALSEGQSRPEVLRNIDAYLESTGISEANPYWLELHYRNNMMTAYNTGRWTQIADNDLVEMLVYNSVMDNGTTKLCKELNDVAKPKSDPFWEEFYPPNHHKCRGTVSVLTRAQFDKLPDNKKREWAKITTASIHDDETFAKEHQFRSSPLVSMKTLPPSLMKNAQEYGLVEKILKYSHAQSQSLIKEQMTNLAKTKVTTSVLNRSIKKNDALNPFKEDLNDLELGTADEVWFGFDEWPEGEFMPALQYVFNLDDKHKAVMMVMAFGGEPAYSVQYYKASDLIKLQADFIHIH
ncbi:phage minor head protein [Vibrio sp. OPT18]|uniref:phage head morphogenesis protein n=1 Tax=Vibrio sp. OPT18 TaxID=2778641 RepID=UPI001881881A|nr:phage minor head protein [Vibrio sp. OPT18]MBE8578650.1 phage head morphogenesis protein [Vibrio sp. OPT18]